MQICNKTEPIKSYYRFFFLIGEEQYCYQDKKHAKELVKAKTVPGNMTRVAL